MAPEHKKAKTGGELRILENPPIDELLDENIELIERVMEAEQIAEEAIEALENS